MYTTAGELLGVQEFYARMPATPLAALKPNWLKFRDRTSAPRFFKALENLELQLFFIDRYRTQADRPHYDQLSIAAVGSDAAVAKAWKETMHTAVPLGVQPYRTWWPQPLWQTEYQDEKGSWNIHQLRRVRMTDGTPWWKPVIALVTPIELTLITEAEFEQHPHHNL